MTQALNYTPKAIESLTAMARDLPELSRKGALYVAEKLRQAQVFLLPDHGVLLESGKVRPEVPGIMFKPPYPVVALEYPAPAETGYLTEYMSVPSSKRIALAWEWQDDLPPEFRDWTPEGVKPGVVVLSLPYSDTAGMWVPIAAASHVAYDEPWADPPTRWSPQLQASFAARPCSKAYMDAKVRGRSLIPILPDALLAAAQLTGLQTMWDALNADLTDEVMAYEGLCYALGCGNVGTEEISAPEKLNKHRLAQGREPLKSYHLLKLSAQAGGAALGGTGAGPRPHLRRGHIRHLRAARYGPAPRITWVNAAMVRPHGAGFVAKDYDLRGRR